MDSDLRAFLYFPLGLLPTLLFALRFFIHWQALEREQKANEALFWKLSLSGNCLMALHYFIQVQFPFSFFQLLNGFISYRNLKLLHNEPSLSPWLRVRAIIALFLLLTLFFLLQSFLFIGWIDWIRTPRSFSMVDQPVEWPFLFHLFGTMSNALFASRFWIQWWSSEDCGISSLSPFFWKLSILGSLASLVYFLFLADFVSSIQYSAQLLPYLRCLQLTERKKSDGDSSLESS